MNVKFGDQELNVRSVKTEPTKFRINDLLVGPDGMLLKVVTVQTGCPIWESNHKSKCVVIFENALGMVIPANGLSGQFQILRPRYN